LKYLNSDLVLLPQWQSGRIDYGTEEDIKRECINILCERNPLFRHMVNIKLVKNPRKNFINLILKQVSFRRLFFFLIVSFLFLSFFSFLFFSFFFFSFLLFFSHLFSKGKYLLSDCFIPLWA